MTSKKILLLNQGKTENLGDKAIDLVLQKVLRTNNVEVISKGFAQTKEQNISDFNPSKIVSNKKILKKILPRWFIWLIKYRQKIKNEYLKIKHHNFDLVIIGGGQLIKSKSIFMYTMLSWVQILKKHNKELPIIILGVGLDPKYNTLEKYIYKKIFSEIGEFYLRDQQSKNTLKSTFGIESNFIPDVVFSYKNQIIRDKNDSNSINKKNELALMIYEYDALKKHFGTQLTKEDYYEEWYKMAKNNSDSMRNVYLSYTTIGDKRETLEFKNYMIKEHNINLPVHYTDTLIDLDTVFQKSNKVISGRMHGMLIALNHNCLVTPYIVSPKIESFKKDYLESNKSLTDFSLEIENTIRKVIN